MAQIKPEQLQKVKELKGKFNELTFIIGQNQIQQKQLKLDEENMFEEFEKLGVEASEVTPEASFTNDLGADSLDTVELIMEFEKEFSVSIPDDQAENIQTVGQAITYLEENAK